MKRPDLSDANLDQMLADLLPFAGPDEAALLNLIRREDPARLWNLHHFSRSWSPDTLRTEIASLKRWWDAATLVYGGPPHKQPALDRGPVLSR